jgi:hypothetical protein
VQCDADPVDNLLRIAAGDNGAAPTMSGPCPSSEVGRTLPAAPPGGADGSERRSRSLGANTCAVRSVGVVHLGCRGSTDSMSVSSGAMSAGQHRRMPRRTNDLRYRELTHLNGAVVIRTSELQAHGISRGTITRRTRPGGPGRPLMPAIVLLHNGPPTRDDMRLAGLLHAGPGAVLTGSDALELHGMSRMPPPTGLIHVLTPADRRRGGAGKLLVERTDRLPAPAPGRWPLASIERAALDVTRRTRDRDVVRAVLAEAVQRGRTTPARLIAELEAGSNRGTALPARGPRGGQRGHPVRGRSQGA